MFKTNDSSKVGRYSHNCPKTHLLRKRRCIDLFKRFSTSFKGFGVEERTSFGLTQCNSAAGRKRRDEQSYACSRFAKQCSCHVLLSKRILLLCTVRIAFRITSSGSTLFQTVPQHSILQQCSSYCTIVQALLTKAYKAQTKTYKIVQLDSSQQPIKFLIDLCKLLPFLLQKLLDFF